MAFLELHSISKYFGQFTAVDTINLSVERGEFLTLLGPSGCGKTTILRMVAGFETPSAGNILLDGEDISNRAASKRRSEEHTSELQSLAYLVCRLLLEKKKKKNLETHVHYHENR